MRVHNAWEGVHGPELKVLYVDPLAIYSHGEGANGVHIILFEQPQVALLTAMGACLSSIAVLKTLHAPKWDDSAEPFCGEL